MTAFYPSLARTTPWQRQWPTLSEWRGAATSTAATATGVLFMHRSRRTWGDLPYYAAPVIPLAIDPRIATWIGPGNAKTVIKLEVETFGSRLAAARDFTTDGVDGFGVGFGAGYAMPTLLHYTRGQRAPNVELSFEPGSPCTAACLKVAGSF